MKERWRIVIIGWEVGLDRLEKMMEEDKKYQVFIRKRNPRRKEQEETLYVGRREIKTADACNRDISWRDVYGKEEYPKIALHSCLA